MTSKTETAKQLLTIMDSENRHPRERLEALIQADALRRELKVGWAKLGAEAEGIGQTKAILEKLVAEEIDPQIDALLERQDQLTSPMTEESHPGVTMADIWQEDIEEGQEAAQVTELEQQVMRCFRTYDTLEGTQSDCGVSWTDAAELSKQSGLSLATVKGVLGSLVKKGWVYADDDTGKPQAQCLTPEGAVVTHELSDFVSPTVVSDAPVANPEPSLSEAPVPLTTAERGAIGVMSRDLLQTNAPYEEIALAIRARYPHAKTTARSLASVAADMRRDGIPCPPRRKGGK